MEKFINFLWDSCRFLGYLVGMGIFGNFSFRSSIGFKMISLIEYSVGGAWP